MTKNASLIGYEFPIGGRMYRVVSYAKGGYVNICSLDRRRQGQTKVKPLHAMRKAAEDKAKFATVGECCSCHGQTSIGNCVFFGGLRYCEADACRDARRDHYDHMVKHGAAASPARETTGGGA